MKFYVHKLGCPKNDVDADYIYARLIHEGHEPVKDPLKEKTLQWNTDNKGVAAIIPKGSSKLYLHEIAFIPFL